jgi:hypothetical protein
MPSKERARFEAWRLAWREASWRELHPEPHWLTKTMPPHWGTAYEKMLWECWQAAATDRSDLRDALEDACLTYAVHGDQPPAKWLKALGRAAETAPQTPTPLA